MNDKSMLEVAIEIMQKSKDPKNIYKLIDEVTEALGYGDDANVKAQLYIDITTSAEFVYCSDEDDLWDLKNRQSLDLWDKSFYGKDAESEEDEEDEEDNISMEDYNYVEESRDDDEDEDSEDDEEDEDMPEEYDIDEDADEDEEDEDSWDDEDDENSWDEDEEEKYNDMMDDYEDLYEDK